MKRYSNFLNESAPKEKVKKSFEVGDVIKCIKTEKGKLYDDCVDFLLTYSKFRVLNVNDKGNVYIGYIRNGEKFYFSSNRFILFDGSTPPQIDASDPFDYDPEDYNPDEDDYSNEGS